MKILTAHQPAYLPWLGFFHKLALADEFCFFESVQYQRRSFDNRNKIYSKTGPLWLTVPVLSAGSLDKDVLYTDLKINSQIAWAKKHWRAIELTYRNTPFFDNYVDDLRFFYETDWEYLVDLNYSMLLYFIRALGISVHVIRMRDYNFVGKKSDLVLNMCDKREAKIYIFGEQGINYCDRNAFADHDVTPYFQSYCHPQYKQKSNQGMFEAYLCILDLLFNCGEESLKILCSGNVTRKDIFNLKGGNCSPLLGTSFRTQ